MGESRTHYDEFLNPGTAFLASKSVAASNKHPTRQIQGLPQPSRNEQGPHSLAPRMAWIRAHQRNVWRYLRWLGADPETADDLTQDAFLLALQKKIENRGHTRARSFLCRTARNLWLRSRRNRRDELAVAREVDILWAQAAQSRATNDDEGPREALRSCLSKLSGRAAEVVHLFYRSGLTREEVALHTGLRPDGVKTLLRRTRQQLKTCIEQEANQ